MKHLNNAKERGVAILGGGAAIKKGVLKQAPKIAAKMIKVISRK
ncbi:hypothetical protein DES36_1168 [Alkalibaculum bacchi]|jgi:hypothetical protein|uniref:Uncharacterized protein n=1 Tax=Alkalibaculum bacchi TaxID=645887 RepID=A0A366I2V6_9FIRM|nr:hypothetical protein [Alkalibaculum bacchi]RBP60352.1 hypothetical protein DES36_1168 [Alkalibaculum bacchi]